MKKVIVMALAGIMTVSMFGCGVSSKKVEVSSAADLADLTVGVQTGTTGDSYATDEVNDDSQMKRYNKGADAIQALKTGKIDCVVIDSLPAEKFVEANDDLKIIENIWEPEEYAMCLKKGNTELLDQMNAALAELKEDGTLDKIMGNYIGDDTGSYQYETPEGTEYPNGKLVMATNAEFAPWEYKEGDEIVGIDPDIVKAMCDKMGYELEIDDMMFESILAAVTSGKADFGAAGMTVTEDRKKNVLFTDTYAQASQVVIVKEGSDIATPDDLAGKTIGVQLGTTGDIYVSDVEGATVERYNKGFEAVQSLLTDKIDAVVIDQEPAKVFVQENEGLVILEEHFTDEEYAIAVAKDNEELQKAINEALAKLKESGKLDEIVAKYITAE